MPEPVFLQGCITHLSSGRTKYLWRHNEGDQRDLRDGQHNLKYLQLCPICAEVKMRMEEEPGASSTTTLAFVEAKISILLEMRVFSS